VHPTKSSIPSSHSMDLNMVAFKAWKTWSFKSPSFGTFEMMFFFQFFQNMPCTQIHGHIFVFPHMITIFLLSSINKRMIIQPNMKNINNQSKGKHNHTHNHMRILKKHLKKTPKNKNYTKQNGTM
jgi:hypothetical protein